MANCEIRQSTIDVKSRGKIVYSDDIRIRNINGNEMCFETSERIISNSIYLFEFRNDNKERRKLPGEVILSLLRGTCGQNENNVPVYEVAIRCMQLNDMEKEFLTQVIAGFMRSPVTG